MPLEYYEAFGIDITRDEVGPAFCARHCPFVAGPCTKTFSDGTINGACSLINRNSKEPSPVPCCPKRLYGDYRILADVVRIAWGEGVPLILKDGSPPEGGSFVVPFGQKQGHEIRIPHKKGQKSSKFSVDWILALVDEKRELAGFVAVEVQTIDTTGNYRRAYWDLAAEHDPKSVEGIAQPAPATASFNFENVNKRIIPQLITKGHILRREDLCTKGLFFVCPTAVYDRVIDRVGELEDYPVQTGSITFLSYSIDQESEFQPKPLILDQVSTTTTDQLSVAFSSPKNLPDRGVYENAIRKALANRLQK